MQKPKWLVVAARARVGVWSETMEGMLYVYSVQTVLSWLVGIICLYLGKKRLSRIE